MLKYISVHYLYASVCRSQKRMLDSPKSELQEVVSHPVWVLGTKQRGHLSRPNIQLFLFIVTALQLKRDMGGCILREGLGLAWTHDHSLKNKVSGRSKWCCDKG